MLPGSKKIKRPSYSVWIWGFNNHIYNMLQEFQEIKRLSDEEIYLLFGDETRVIVLVIEFFFICISVIEF